MKISEVIEKLTEFKNKYGNIDVVVECRDTGGSYNEFTEILEFYIEKNIYEV